MKAWKPAPRCRIVHPYGEDGWRPGGPNQPHEHWTAWTRCRALPRAYYKGSETEDKTMSRFSHEYPENYESVLEDYMEEADRRRRERIIEGMIAFPPTASGKVDAILEAYIALRRAEKASPHSDTTPEPEKP